MKQNFELQPQVSQKRQKTKQDYSRNVKKLKYKLTKISDEIQSYQRKIKSLQNTSNDQLISMKIGKFCKQRRFTPQMLFRFADIKSKNSVHRAQFKSTLIAIGLKLSQQQITRLQYLLDQDISGQISWQEYNKYLHAFGLKKQFSNDDPFVKDALQKLDINKILEITKNQKDKKNKNLLTYEQFLHYCHKHFPQLKDKQLSQIFQNLSEDALIDLAKLIDYLNKIIERQKKAQKQKQTAPKFQQIPQEQQKIDILTLKGKLMAIVKAHPKEQQTFHSSEFKRIQTIKQYKNLLQRGQISKLFKQIDFKKHLGSIGFNEIISYFMKKQLQIPQMQIQIPQKQFYEAKNENEIKYTFILMGLKLLSKGQKAQSLVEMYSNHKTHITKQQFANMCLVEFQLKKHMATSLYQIMLRSNPKFVSKQNHISTEILINLMKFNKRNYRPPIRPVIQGNFANYLFKKQCQTICTNGLIAFKMCHSIAEQIMPNQKWNDYQFGPSPDDEFGLDDIGRNYSDKVVRWISAPILSMKQFFIPFDREDKIYSITSLCENDIFHKSLQMLIKQNPTYMHRKISQISKMGNKIDENQLIKLFQGIRPLAFHDFQSKGIFVFKFYIKAKWVYVIVDDKIPCNEKGQLLFSQSNNKNSSYISLIQKAYAKLKGSYQKIFQLPSLSKYIYQLSSNLSYSQLIQNMDKDQDDLKQWRKIHLQTNRQLQKIRLYKSNENRYQTQKYYLTNQTLTEKKVRVDAKSGFPTNLLVGLNFTMQFQDKKQSSNNHKLMLIDPQFKVNNQEKWNQWHKSSDNYKNYLPLLKQQIMLWNKENKDPIAQKQTILLDFQKVQNMFNSLFVTKAMNFSGDMVIMRKIIEFQKDFTCLYKVNCTDNQKYVRLIVLINKLNAPLDCKVSIKMKNSILKQNVQTKSQTVRGQFGCFCFWVPSEQQDLQIKVDKFQPGQQHIYQISFYFEHPRYSLKQRDRHLLFRYVSSYQQSSKLDFDILSDSQQQWFHKFFPNLGRKGVLCC